MQKFLLLLLGALAFARPALADDVRHGEDRPYRIGIITYAGPGLETTVKEELARRGLVEGKTVTYRMLAGQRDMNATRAMAKELVAWKPDVIISMMTNAHLAVQEATRDNPVPVAFWSTDPKESGIIQGYRSSGTNFTGFSAEPWNNLLELRLLKLAIPNLKCVGHLWNHTYAPAPGTKRALERDARLFGLKLIAQEALTDDQIEPAIKAFQKAGCGGFVVGPHELLNRNGNKIGKWALENGLAAVAIQTSVTDGGGLAAYSPPFQDGWTSMARVVERILNGEKPSDIPVARRFASPLTLNLRAAKALKLELPAELVDEADVIIQ